MRYTGWAAKREYVQRDVLAAWARLSHDEKRYRRDLSAEEVTAVLAAEDNEELKLRWLVYFYTALRNSAGAALAWEWIDWEGRLINLPIKNNKSKRPHRIPLHPDLHAALQAKHEAQGRPTTGSVFDEHRRGRLLEVFQRTCRRAGLDMRGVCLHSVRHTVATKIYEASGKDIRAVQEVLGHANVATTAQYLHIDDEVKRNAVEGIRYF